MSITHTTVIDVSTLADHLDDPAWTIIDCRFDLSDTAAGVRAYERGHIPGAVYAHLDRDLSGPKHASGRGGRHPLPTPSRMTQVFGRLGIGPQTQVAAYDDTSGHYAARLWWMLRFMGHDAVALVDGGWPAWVAAELPIVTGREEPAERLFEGAPRWTMVTTIEEVPAAPLLVDARAPERYRGEVEPIDAAAGHIPGAVNRPYAANWAADGRWRSQESLLADFTELLGDAPAEEAVFYCGSGVSACVNVVAMARAGLPPGRLYVGSWSEWSRLR
jgi:thiosulfate/3-mercaptopyruvate sulfurtransferase